MALASFAMCSKMCCGATVQLLNCVRLLALPPTLGLRSARVPFLTQRAPKEICRAGHVHGEGSKSSGICVLPIMSAAAANTGEKEKKRKESIVDLSKYLDKAIRVKFQGGREATGILKGYDPLLNLVIDNATEFLRDPDDPYKLTDDTRTLGLVVCRGTAVVVICPVDGMESIPNPFVQHEG